MERETLHTVAQGIRELEQVLRAPHGFFVSLVNAPDWEFVVKLHTLFESAVTHLVTTELKRPELRPFVARLDMSSDVGGKLALAKLLGLMQPHERGVIRFLSEIRNQLIHNVGSHPFSLEVQIASLSSDRRKKYLEFVTRNWHDPIDLNGRLVPRDKFFLENPRIGFWSQAMQILFGIYVTHKIAELGVQQSALAQALRDYKSQ